MSESNLTASHWAQGKYACLIHLQLLAYSQTLKDFAQLWEVATNELVQSSHGICCGHQVPPRCMTH